MNHPKQPRRGALASALLVLLGALAIAPCEAEGMNRAVDDVELRAQIEEVLLADIAVPSKRLEVSVVNGIVLLSGAVDNILARERAIRQAESIEGVRAVVGNIGVDPSFAPDDDDLVGDIDAALRADAATEAYEIDPWVEDGLVTLGGTVDSWQERFLVEQVVKGVPGVREIDNVIAVEPTPARADGEIRAEIEKALRLNPLIDAGKIDVAVSDGRVHLRGAVGSTAERRRIVAEAWTTGVRAVDPEDLRVVESSRRAARRAREQVYLTDEEIVDAVNDALLLDPRVLSTGIEVVVENGIVTLRGEVDGDEERRAAADDARHTAGVHLVRNRLVAGSGLPARR